MLRVANFYFSSSIASTIVLQLQLKKKQQVWHELSIIQDILKSFDKEKSLLSHKNSTKQQRVFKHNLY